MKVFIGYDSRFDDAYQVAKHSLFKVNDNVEVYPLKLDKFKNLLFREHDHLASTEFTISRFLVPYLSDYTGFSLFVDCDVLFLEDPMQMLQEIEFLSNCDVYCVPHNYSPMSNTKMNNQVQYKYECKNWSSVMLFNNLKCQYLNLKYINSATPLELHQFKWADTIGKLDKKWNHLVGYYDNPNPSIIHYTDGGPWIKDYENCEYANEWITNYNELRDKR